MKGNIVKKLLVILAAFASFNAVANEGAALDHAPVNLSNQASLQRGAKVFVNYCLGCHSASSMRYNRLRDIGLDEKEIKDNLLFNTDKVGNTMTTVMPKKESKAWFGATPPDLSVVARSRGADWLYTYLRGFYRDDTRPTGWNNVVFDKVAMPHVLWNLQGTQVLKESAGHSGLVLEHAGSMTTPQYDAMVGDLVNYLVWMGEPGKLNRMKLGLYALAFLGLLLILAYQLKKEYWRDIKH